jgi:hypothetical protein
LVQTLVVPEAWTAGGGSGTIQADGDALVVSQNDRAHYQILEFCEKLRGARGKPFRSRLDPSRFSLDTRLSRLSAKLTTPISANFHEPTPITRILEFLQEVSDVRILVDWLTLGDDAMLLQVEATLTVRDEPLEDILAKLLWPAGLEYRAIDGGTIEVSSRQVVTQRLDLEFYPIGDLTDGGRSSESIIELIKRQVAGDTWDDAGGSGLIRLDQPSAYLLVLQSQPVHRKIEELLGKLRVADSGR